MGKTKPPDSCKQKRNPNIQVVFTAGDRRKENKNELRIKFAEERVKEIEDLVEDDDNLPVSKDISTEDNEKVSAGIELALNLLANLEEQQVENLKIDDIVRRLNAFITNLPLNSRIEVDGNELKIKFENDESEDDNDVSGKIKIRTDDGKIKIPQRFNNKYFNKHQK